MKIIIKFNLTDEDLKAIAKRARERYNENCKRATRKMVKDFIFEAFNNQIMDYYESENSENENLQ